MQPQPVTPQHQGNGLAVSSLVLGVIGVVLSFTPLLGIIPGLILGPLAMVFGVVGKSKADRGAPYRGMAVAGIILGWITIFVILSILAGEVLLPNSSV